AGSGWLPEPLRTKGVETMATPADTEAVATQTTAANDSADVVGEEVETADLPSAEDHEHALPHEIAAE
ncbi:MAG: hypothetical protein POH28_10710, partial [Acidocella sp.]|nr:hypothetical protein [Acidocella sp.]